MNQSTLDQLTMSLKDYNATAYELMETVSGSMEKVAILLLLLFAGKSAVFTITLNNVSEATLPEVDADFAKALGIEDGIRFKRIAFSYGRRTRQASCSRFPSRAA